MPQPEGAFITLDEVIKQSLASMGETTMRYYQKSMQSGMRAVGLLQMDVLRNFKRTFLGVDNATQSAKLPDDFTQAVRIGLMTQNNEFVPLAYNPSLITTVTVPDCDTENVTDEHCTCGCNDELCAAIGHSNIYTTTEDVVINGVTYQKTISVCTSDDGKIARETCAPYITNPLEECHYFLDCDLTTITPVTDFKIIRSDTILDVGYIVDGDALVSVLDSYGFTASNFDEDVTATITTSLVYQSVTFTDVDDEPVSINFVQSACAIPTPIVETICNTETVCDTEVLPCGCIVPTDLQIQVLFNTCPFLCAVTSRQRWNKDFGQTFAQPKGFFGEYALDVYNGIIRFNWDYGYDSVFLEYYSVGVVDSKDYLVPIQAIEAIEAYILYRHYYLNPTKPKGIGKEYQQLWLNQKRILKARLHPLNLDKMMQAMRVFQRP